MQILKAMAFRMAESDGFQNARINVHLFLGAHEFIVYSVYQSVGISEGGLLLTYRMTETMEKRKTEVFVSKQDVAGRQM